MDMKERSIMSEEKKTPKLSEEIKKKHADKFCMSVEGLIIKDVDGKEIKLEDLMKKKK